MSPHASVPTAALLLLALPLTRANTAQTAQIPAVAASAGAAASPALLPALFGPSAPQLAASVVSAGPGATVYALSCAGGNANDAACKRIADLRVTSGDKAGFEAVGVEVLDLAQMTGKPSGDDFLRLRQASAGVTLTVALGCSGAESDGQVECSRSVVNGDALAAAVATAGPDVKAAVQEYANLSRMRLDAGKVRAMSVPVTGAGAPAAGVAAAASSSGASQSTGAGDKTSGPAVVAATLDATTTKSEVVVNATTRVAAVAGSSIASGATTTAISAVVLTPIPLGGGNSTSSVAAGKKTTLATGGSWITPTGDAGVRSTQRPSTSTTKSGGGINITPVSSGIPVGAFWALVSGCVAILLL